VVDCGNLPHRLNLTQAAFTMPVLTSNFLWLKAFHIIFLVTWFAGLFYLPRLFVYHSTATDALSVERFRVMERKLFVMTTIGAVLTITFGVLMVLSNPVYRQMPWFHIKMALVVLLVIYHLWCLRLLRQFAKDQNRHSHRWYRWFNEVPSLLLIAIVILVVVKPSL